MFIDRNYQAFDHETIKALLVLQYNTSSDWNWALAREIVLCYVLLQSHSLLRSLNQRQPFIKIPARGFTWNIQLKESTYRE